MFKPLDRICVYRYIYNWYDIGGERIDYGLPIYVAIYHKLESVCEIQDTPNENFRIMMCLRLVKMKVD